MKKPTLRTQIRLWKLRAQAAYLVSGLLLLLAMLRYHLLCFKHFGWVRLFIALLKTPEHLKAVGLALFTHPASSPSLSRPIEQARRGNRASLTNPRSSL